MHIVCVGVGGGIAVGIEKRSAGPGLTECEIVEHVGIEVLVLAVEQW